LQAWQAWVGQEDIAGNHTFRITFRLHPPPDETELWHLDYLLQANDDPSLLISAAALWQGIGLSYLIERFDQPHERLLRGLAWAGRLFEPILTSLHSPAPQAATFDTDNAYTFLQTVAPLLQSHGFRVLLPREWNRSTHQIRVKHSVQSAGASPSRMSLASLLHYQVELMLGDHPLSREELEQLATLKQPLVQLRGQWILLDADLLAVTLQHLQAGESEVSLREVLQMGLTENEAAPVELDSALERMMNALRHPEALELLPTPEGLRADLRPYQQRGVAWLSFLQRHGLGACLADDMGLGKTLQTIAFFLHFRMVHLAPALIVCPTSVVSNWRREIQRFAPQLRVFTHQGTAREQGDAFQQQLQGVDVVLTSYPLLARDRNTLSAVQWSLVVLDEAQNIKNSGTQQAQAARTLSAIQRVALTGTPIENRLSELWSIFQFINPHYLGSETDFRKRFTIPIEKFGDDKAAQHLRQLTTPFILRRLKTDPLVISDLPEKQEMKVYLSLTAEQITLYEAVVKDVMQQIEDAEAEGIARRGLVLSLLMQLKQICNHPAQYLKDGSQIEGRSGKVTRLTEMLEEIYAAGDRVLIFTQFAEMGELLYQHCRQTFYDEPLWLHGSTKVKTRDELVRRFQAEHGPTVFLLSLKAGGVGLNLTRANHVIHFDRWWNPAVENQATDRAFRIGQTRNVQVHKFICAGTLEEKIDALIESKQALAEQIVGQDESGLTELSTAALYELVRLQKLER